MATKKEDTAKSEVDDNVENEKVKEAVEVMTETPSSEQSSDAGDNKLASMMMALIVAIPTAAIVAYIVVPNELNNLISKENSSYLATVAANPQSQNPVVLTTNNRNQSQQPAWVIEHRAEMEKHRLAIEKQNADAFSAKGTIPEPPQWVKDQQAQMEKEKAKYQEWAKQSAASAPSRGMGYRQQSNPAIPGNQAPVQQNSGQYNGGYAYPVNPSQNRPYYTNGPYGYPPHR